MSKDKIRESFEAWWRSEMNIEVFDLHRCEFPMQKPEFVQPYACHDTQRAWMAWQASREALVIELPARIDHTGCSHAIEACRKAIEASGVKVKS